MNRIVNITANNTELSLKTKTRLSTMLEKAGFIVSKEFNHHAELTVCIGGDGAFLQTMHEHNFPSMPIIGINTGHLGFFQEISPDKLDDFIFNYTQNMYRLQKLTTVKATVKTEDGATTEHIGLNEIVIRGSHSYSIHLNISIGDSFIERFSGDGILVATPSGSTAYNYSLGGSIVDPRLNLLQVTPIAPMNTTAYRCFTSSILLPSDLSLGVIPENIKDTTIYIDNDGYETRYENVKNIRIEFADKIVQLLRFDTYDFWNKVKTKFL